VAAGDEFGEQHVAFAFGPSLSVSLRDAWNNAIMALKTSGMLDDLYRAYFAAPGSCSDTPSSITLKDGLGLTELSGIFFAGFVGIAASLLLLGFEWAVWPSRRSSGCCKGLNKGFGWFTSGSRARAERAEEAFTAYVPAPKHLCSR